MASPEIRLAPSLTDHSEPQQRRVWFCVLRCILVSVKTKRFGEKGLEIGEGCERASERVVSRTELRE